MRILTALRPVQGNLLGIFLLTLASSTVIAVEPPQVGDGPTGTCPPPPVTQQITEAPKFDWEDKKVLWLGTSIPHQGHGVDGYPELFCELMGCRVTNNAFSGSRMRWFETGKDESCKKGKNAPKGLTATNRELQEKITAAATAEVFSSYDEACNKATSPIRMGYEYRINAVWPTKRFDVVVLDHGHNDRSPDKEKRNDSLGSLHPATIAIKAIKLGLVTEVTLSDQHGLVKNDDITLRTPGIPQMDFWTGEVSSVNGTNITVMLDSSSFVGTYSAGGTAVKYDKTKVYDAYNLIISDIYHMNARYGGGPVMIVLMTPPTEWTHGKNDGSIAAINDAIYRIAVKWGLQLYNMTDDLKIGADNLRTLLPDSVHPTTTAARQVIADHIAAWAKSGGSRNKTCP
ncbi:MAG: hypothetical protein KJ795_01375 [Gammaproteobacteria bacterium]|nr:hypothetical protein [Gammaproteobacteria bacterium]MBU1777821.1 hypothetical protein [Gammaproteobacteria bacterium]